MEECLSKDPESKGSPSEVSKTPEERSEAINMDPTIQSEDHLHLIRRQSTY